MHDSLGVDSLAIAAIRSDNCKYTTMEISSTMKSLNLRIRFRCSQCQADWSRVRYLSSGSHLANFLPGSFIAPRIPGVVENKLMGDLARTYGKTWVFWQVDRGDSLPLGSPQLIGVANGKELDWDPKLFKQRDKAMSNRYQESMPMQMLQ